MYNDEIAAISAAFNASDVRIVGEGAGGITFRVQTPCDVTALKLFKPNFDLERTAREIDSLKLIRSRNVVTFLDDGSLDVKGQQRRYFRAEFIDGETLEAIIARSSFSKSDLRDLGIQVAQGLTALQVVGVVHRDIKPANILIENGGRIVIVDLGLAGRLGAVRLTASNTFIGTPLYAAPEQFGNAVHVDIRADIFSLGVVLFEAAAGSGSHPFGCNQTMSPQDIYTRIRTIAPTPHPIRAFQPVVASMLQAQAFRRLNTPSVLLDALGRIK
jgi:serine/threonine-protein kinase